MKSLLQLSLMLTLYVAMSTTGVMAQGVLFSEHRIILNGNTITSVQVCNPTEQTRTFNISVIDKSMDEQGVIHEIADSVVCESSIKKYLRVFPRIMTLGAGECQEVQIQLKAPLTIASGEYRSYLYFQPLEATGGIEQGTSVDGVKFAIRFRVGAAIPIIYRKQTSITQVKIDSVFLSPMPDGRALLHLTILREGSQSLYGDCVVEGVSKGEPLALVTMPSNAVYHEMKKKHLTFPISTEALDRDALGRVRLTISFVDAENKQSKTAVILARTEVDVGVPDEL